MKKGNIENDVSKNFETLTLLLSLYMTIVITFLLCVEAVGRKTVSRRVEGGIKIVRRYLL